MDKENNNVKRFFEVAIKDGLRTGYVYAPSSINYPYDNTVMFVTSNYVREWGKLLSVQGCLIYWPSDHIIPDKLLDIHFVVSCERPRLEFAKFFKKNHLYEATLDKKTDISIDDFRKRNITIMPNVYIGGNVSIGDNVYIGSGVRLVGRIKIGDNVIIRENSVLGADGLAMEREEDGTMIPIPQFGGVEIQNNVIIGSNVVIARGSIDDTIIKQGCMIDNSCFISHNVVLEENVAVVGESILFGSACIGKNSFISGNVTVRDQRKIGENSLIGMGSVVLQDVEKGSVVCGNPAKTR